MKINDKVKNIIIVVLVLLIVFGGSFFASELRQPDEEVTTEYSVYNELTLNGYLDLVKSDKLTVIYVGNETCVACATFDPILKPIVEENNIVIYHLNLARVKTQTDANKVYESYDDFKENGINTPTLLIVKGGKVIAAQVGAKTTDVTTEFFKTNNIIK